MAGERNDDSPAALGRDANGHLRAQRGAKLLFELGQVARSGDFAFRGLVATAVALPPAVCRPAMPRRRQRGGLSSAAWIISCTSSSTARTLSDSAAMRQLIATCSRSSPSGSSARAWPWLMAPDRSDCCTSSGRSSKRIRLAIVERSTFSRAGQLGLRAAVALEVLLKRSGLFQRVEIAALQVFDDRQLGHLPIVGFANLHRHARSSRP